MVVSILLTICPTDMFISFPEDRPEALVGLQVAHWSPVFKWAKEKHAVDIRSFASVFRTTQPQETLNHFEIILANMDSWTLAGIVAFYKA